MPTVHGINDALLNGSSNLRADRDAARAMTSRWPALPGLPAAVLAFRNRAAQLAADRGITRFIRAGAVTRLPGRNTHDVVRGIQPDARTVYVTASADACALIAGLLEDDPRTEVVQGRSRHPGQLLSAPPVAALLADEEPVALILASMLSFVGSDVAEAIVKEYAGALPSGSVLALSVLVLDDSAEGRELAAMYEPAPLRRHTEDDLREWLNGLEVLPPGVADVRVLAAGDGTVGVLPQGLPVHAAGAVAVVP